MQWWYNRCMQVFWLGEAPFAKAQSFKAFRVRILEVSQTFPAHPPFSLLMSSGIYGYFANGSDHTDYDEDKEMLQIILKINV